LLNVGRTACDDIAITMYSSIDFDLARYYRTHLLMTNSWFNCCIVL
jgi:hypothetical protein